MIVTSVETSLYLYFSSFVPSLASDCMKVQKLVFAVQKQILSALTKKIGINHQIIFLIWIFLKACSIKFTFKPQFKVFWFELQKYPEQIIYYLLFCFSQILSRFAFPSFCKPRACFFFAKTFWQSWETVELQEYLYFQQGIIILLRVLTSLIRLWWVMYEGSFQVCEGRW